MARRATWFVNNFFAIDNENHAGCRRRIRPETRVRHLLAGTDLEDAAAVADLGLTPV
jgi:hypothetical protein